MFVKITKARQHKYVQIVNSYREGDKVKHQVLYHLGRLDELEKLPSFKNVVLRLAEIVGLQCNQPNTEFTDNCSPAKIVNWGYLVYKKLWNKFNITTILEQIQQRYKITYLLTDVCFLMVIQHLLAPKSKLASFNTQDLYAKIATVELNHLYRALDILAEHKTEIEKHLFHQYKLTKKEINVVFYDVTTFSFESVRADSLKNFGYSKDKKFNEVQVVLGLLIDQNGHPIGYELFPGNTFEGKTLEQSLHKINKNFNIRNVIIVADRGINSRINLVNIKNQGYGYIVAAKIKSMTKIIKEQILNKDDYKYLNHKEEGFRYKILVYNNAGKVDGKKITLTEQLIVTYSPKRAHKDTADRERLIAKANYLLQEPGKINNLEKRGGKKYLTKGAVVKEETWKLDEAKIAADQIYDGYYAIQTSETNLTPEEVLSAYHTLWKIEESFKVMKSTLEVRPIFHWTEKRIEGHFVIAFLAFLLERSLENQLQQANITASPNTIREAINSMNFAEVTLTDKNYYIKTEITELATEILKLSKMKIYKNLFPVEQFCPEAS